MPIIPLFEKLSFLCIRLDFFLLLKNLFRKRSTGSAGHFNAMKQKKKKYLYDVVLFCSVTLPLSITSYFYYTVSTL